MVEDDGTIDEQRARSGGTARRRVTARDGRPATRRPRTRTHPMSPPVIGGNPSTRGPAAAGPRRARPPGGSVGATARRSGGPARRRADAARLDRRPRRQPRVAGDERIATPPLRPLHRLEQRSRPVARDRREQGRRACRRRPGARPRRARAATPPRVRRTSRDRGAPAGSGSWLHPLLCLARSYLVPFRIQETPDRGSGARGRCVIGRVAGARAPGSTSPEPPPGCGRAVIRRRWCHEPFGPVNERLLPWADAPDPTIAAVCALLAAIAIAVPAGAHERGRSEPVDVRVRDAGRPDRAGAASPTTHDGSGPPASWPRPARTARGEARRSDRRSDPDHGRSRRRPPGQQRAAQSRLPDRRHRADRWLSRCERARWPSYDRTGDAAARAAAAAPDQQHVVGDARRPTRRSSTTRTATSSSSPS